MLRMKTEHNTSTDIDLRNENLHIRPIMRKDANGKMVKLNNAEVVNLALDSIEKLPKNQPLNVSKKFQKWLKECKEHVDNGGNTVDFINETVDKYQINLGD